MPEIKSTLGSKIVCPQNIMKLLRTISRTPVRKNTVPKKSEYFLFLPRER